MSNSTSTLPATILAVVVLAILVVFYIADRNSSSSVAEITHHADVNKMVSSKQKYETHRSVFDHTGYSGSLKDYLQHSKGGESEDSRVVKEHVSYAGSGKEYVQKHNAEHSAQLQANAEEHAGYSGSLKEYLSGNYSNRSTAGQQQQAAKSSAKSNASSSTSYSGSVDKYLKKYGN